MLLPMNCLTSGSLSRSRGPNVVREPNFWASMVSNIQQILMIVDGPKLNKCQNESLRAARPTYFEIILSQYKTT